MKLERAYAELGAMDLLFERELAANVAANARVRNDKASRMRFCENGRVLAVLAIDVEVWDRALLARAAEEQRASEGSEHRQEQRKAAGHRL